MTARRRAKSASVWFSIPFYSVFQTVGGSKKENNNIFLIFLFILKEEAKDARRE